MTMPTQRLTETNCSDYLESCDKKKSVCDDSTTNCKLDRCTITETVAKSISEDADVDNMITEDDIDSLSDKFDSIDLIQDIQRDRIRFDEFEVSIATSSVDTHGYIVHCRGPCIDVQKVYRQDDDGDTLLNIALIILAPELALYFIDMTPHFSWLNIPNKLSQTPLHLAVLTKQAGLVRRLVVGGANLEARDKHGNMPIHLACRENLIYCIRALLEPVRYEEQKRNNYDIPFQKVPQNMAAKNYEGLTCLHIASLMDNLDIVKILIDNGANLNSRAEKSGRTVLHEAAWSGKLILVKYLISLGNRCNINAKTYDGYTAFDLARSRRHWSIVIELATAGANSDVQDMD